MRTLESILRKARRILEGHDNDLVTFEEKGKIRRVWYSNEWYYSVIDIIAVLSESSTPRKYWATIKARAKSEGFEETLGQIVQLKLKSSDGKFRLTDTANEQTLFRLIQSVPSPKAEPFRLWLAKVGKERIEEIEHPEKAIERVKERYRAEGRDEHWIETRIESDLRRNRLTDEWKDRGAKEGTEFAILTNTIHEGTFDITVQSHRKYKLLPTRANLRDHMTELELALVSLSEATAITLHQDRDSQGFRELKKDATDAGDAGREAREVIERRIKGKVVTPQNFLATGKRDRQRHITQGQKQLLPFEEEPNDGTVH